MNFFQNLSLRLKLIIAAIIPLLALAYYLQINIRQNLGKKESAQNVIKDVSVVQELSKVVHEFQKERALSLSYASSKGGQGKEQIA